MRTMTVGCALAALVSSGMMAGGAAAQAPGAGYQQPETRLQPRPAPPAPPMAQGPASRWGSQVGGRWWGGMNAPGGYGAYRAPVRGYRLPRYWIAPRFIVNDWRRHGFAAPSPGYRWARYYDDAVLIDGRGDVFDSVGGVDWDRYAGDVRRDGGPDRGPDRGLGGAAVGAVAGGVAGNLIGGHGNRLGGTLIGAGVGAAAGYAIDKAGRGGADYREPPRAGGYPPPPFAHGDRGDRGGRTVTVLHGDHARWSSADGSTTVVTTSGGGYPGGGFGYDAGYAYGGGSVTTVTVQSAPVVTTTTTTEVIENRVTYRPVHVRKAYRTKYIRRHATCACGS